MFTLKQKREIADKVQKILRATGDPELPIGEIKFLLYVEGRGPWAWADIHNNGAIAHDCARYEVPKTSNDDLDTRSLDQEH